jgi:hypothetical protein
MASNNIIDFQTYKEAKEDEKKDQSDGYVVHELMCVKCYHRYISADPEKLWLADIKCHKCGTVGTTICTGQWIPDRDDLMEAAEYVYEEYIHKKSEEQES